MYVPERLIKGAPSGFRYVSRSRHWSLSTAGPVITSRPSFGCDRHILLDQLESQPNRVSGDDIVVREECFGSHAADLPDATLTNDRLFFGEVVASADMPAVWTGGRSLQNNGLNTGRPGLGRVFEHPGHL